MKMCIAEKPSVAKEIANILGATTRRNGYLEGNGYCVTWTFGHLCTLQEPGEYTEKWQKWNLGVLPMIPSKFRIRLIEDEGIKKQFAVIEELVSKAEMVINCGDAGQEGELIQRGVLTKAKCGQGEIVKGKTAWGCTLYRKSCDFLIPMEIQGKKLTQKQVDTLIQKGQTGKISGFKDPEGNSFNGMVRLDENKNIIVDKI